MIDLVLLNYILTFLIVTFALLIAFLIFNKDPKSKINQTFVLLIFFYVLWIIFGLLANIAEKENFSLLLMRARFAVVSLFFISAYFFPVFFPYEGKRYKKLDAFAILAGISFFILSIATSLIVAEVKLQPWGTEVILGSWAFCFYVTISLLTFIIVWQLIKKYLECSRQNRRKLQYFLVGVFLSVFINFVFNIVFPILGTYKYYQIGDYSIIFIIALTAYAIVKKELFGIKVILAEALIFLISIILLINIFISSDDFLGYAWNGFLFLAFIFFSFFLIKSISKRERAKKQVQKYAQKLKKANERLKELDQQKTEFISFAAHQLRSPLTSVRGFASLILEDSFGKMPVKIKEAVQNVFNSSSSMINSVEDFLNITRMEQGRMEYDLEIFDIQEVAEAMINELQPNAYEKKLKLSLTSDKQENYRIEADQIKVKQIIGNLVDNAIKYTKEGSVKVHLSCQGNKRVRLSVSDTGAGMSEETINKLFNRYSRADNTKAIQGTGLGLFIAKKMVEAQKGKIWAESEGEGKGSTFYVEFPLVKDV